MENRESNKHILVSLIAGILCGILVAPLWNYIMPYIFDVQKISVLQGFALYVLSNILIKNRYYTNKE